MKDPNLALLNDICNFQKYFKWILGFLSCTNLNVSSPKGWMEYNLQIL